MEFRNLQEKLENISAYKLLLFPDAVEDPEVFEMTVAGLAMKLASLVLSPSPLLIRVSRDFERLTC